MASTQSLLHPNTALALVLERVAPRAREKGPLTAIRGRYLAEGVVARDNHPPFPASTMDGYAVVAEDASPWREVIGYQAAGEPIDVEVSDGQAVRIMTGAPLPRGADAVVRQEATEVAEDHVIIHQEMVTPGENVRKVGSDVGEGQLVIPAGTRLGPVEIGLLATLGYAEAPVYRRPKVAVISTGDELVEPGEPVGPGQIRDSNRFSVAAAIEEIGAEVVFMGHARDDLDATRALFASLPDDLDVLVTNGGISVGDRDLVGALIGETAEVHFNRLFMKPGKPLTFATRDSLVIFGLPGNPVSSMVSLELFVRPALLTMLGARDVRRPQVTVAVEHAVTPADRIEYQRAVVNVGADGRLTARTTGSQTSSRLASMLGANALLIVEPSERPYPAGQQLPAMLLDVPYPSSSV